MFNRILKACRIGGQVIFTSVQDTIFLEAEAVVVALEGAAVAAGVFASDLCMTLMFIFYTASCSFIIVSSKSEIIFRLSRSISEARDLGI